jgi:membrane-bound lytic murein transglycosylase
MTGKRSLAADALAAMEGTPVWVAATDPASQVRADHDLPDMRAVDAVSRQCGTATADDGRTRYAASPADLTGLGMKLTEALREVADAGAPLVVVDSVSTLLLYSELDRVYQFLHVANNRVDAVDGRTVHLLHTDGTDDEAVATLTPLYSHVVDVRRSGDVVEYRYTGRDTADSGWRSLE